MRMRFPPPNESNDAEPALLAPLERLVLRTRRTRRIRGGVSKGPYLGQEWRVDKARDFRATAGALRDEGLVLEFPMEYVD
ncbi:hypothetical protein Hypma_004615 [Hypsizygus marmoreus]|uniref:Uncharacterized protein n=1 Tax=Hypsizygus marmoreus TaxID=39966 RepID=A0A369JXT7_HYPMA|nr:hypothetical protein Hypma_004615 [Hypsizygus marmoreus]